MSWAKGEVLNVSPDPHQILQNSPQPEEDYQANAVQSRSSFHFP